MIRSKLFWKVLLAYACGVLLTAWLIGAYFSRQQRDVVERQLRERLHEAAILLAGPIEHVFRAGDATALQQHLEEFGRERPTRITLIDANGIVLGDSDEDPVRMENHADRPEVREALRNPQGVGYSQRFSETLQQNMLYCAVRQGSKDRPVGYVRVALPLEAVTAHAAAVRQSVWMTAIVATGVVLLLTVLGASHIVRPLDRLTAAAQEISEGNLTQTIDIRRHDDFGRLAEAFNTMSRRLAARINESEARQRQLESNRNFLETVLGTMVEGVIAVDAGQRVVFANDAGRRLLDCSTPQIVERRLWEVARHPDIQQVVQDVLDEQSQKRVELKFPRGQRVVDLLVSRLPGQPCPGAVLVLHDVTELRRLEGMRREFVSNVSHELKTPLAAIQAYTETLLDGAIDDSGNNRRFLTQIELQAEQLHALVLDMLRLQRIESAQEAYDIHPVSLAETLNACIAAHTTVAESKRIALSAEPTADDLHVLADADEVRTILDNLVDNALNYTPSGGRVTVRCAAEDGMGRIEVQDTGIGIPEEHRARIFERFYRVDKARSRELGGTGLGLSIIKHLVQTFGGRVEVDSEVGVGSTFTVFLPLAQAVSSVEAAS